MMFIKILRRPFGEAPEWVRDAWIGLSLPTPQKSARTWHVLSALSALSGRKGPLLGLVDVIRGKSSRISGFMVNGKTAVDLLAETQPAAAEWWRTNAPGYLSGREYVIFDAACCEHSAGPSTASEFLWGSSRFRKAYPASPGRIGLLWVAATLIRIVAVMAFPGEEMRPVSSILYQSGTPILAAFVAAWTLRLRGSTLHLVCALASLDVVLSAIALAMMIIAPDATFIFWFVAGLYFAIIACLIGGVFSGLRSRKRRAAAILLIIGLNVAAGYLQSMDSAFWRLSWELRSLTGQPETEDKEDDAPPQIDADLLWGAQPGLVQKAISGLQPRSRKSVNVYSVAVAGSGAQTLFSREAHEALRVAALHFGDRNRGGVLLSNGAADLMAVPLATRGNVAAVAKGVIDKVDPQRDLLFLYFTSHGSRTAELSSDLPDYQSVQPISAVSTAEALRKAGASRRVIVISACFAATWIPALATDDTIIITAAAKDRTSFGCDDSRRFTLFGESFLGSLARKGVSLHDAFEDAKRKISTEEAKERITPSLPQVYVGRNMEDVWLSK